VERLRAVILPFKAKLWRLWWVSQELEIVTAACAVLLEKQVLSASEVQIQLWVCYSSLFLAVRCTVWSHRGCLYLEKSRHDLALEEVSIKEERRLSDEIGTGDAHGFGRDSPIQGYSKPPEAV